MVNHLLADKRKKYHVRGVTRDVSSLKAKELASRGVEVVQGDLEHKDALLKVRAAKCLPAASSITRQRIQLRPRQILLIRYAQHPCDRCNALRRLFKVRMQPS